MRARIYQIESSLSVQFSLAESTVCLFFAYLPVASLAVMMQHAHIFCSLM
jgi:hypothetical protein